MFEQEEKIAVDINYIEAFISLVNHKSFTRAAEELFISQSTLSYRLEHLEKDLDTQLIIRSRGKKTFELTQAGVEFIPLAERWLALASDTAHFKNDTYQRVLTVSSVETISFQLSDLFAQITAEQPFMLSLHSYQSWKIITDVESQVIDVGFAVRERASRNAKIVPIFSEKHYLIGCLHTDKRVIDPRTLDRSKELLTDWGASYRSWHDSYFAPDHRPKVEVENAYNACNFFADGVWCIVPASALLLMQINCSAFGHPIQVYELSSPPPNRICYKVTSYAPRPNRVENIRYFEERLDKFLKERDLHL